MNRTFIAALMTLPLLSSAAVDWKPEFKDAPVKPEHVESVKKAVPKTCIVEPEQDRRILVFSATAGFRHNSIPTGLLALDEMGKSSGAYEAVISDDPANFELEVLKGFDSVVLLSPTQDFFMPNKKKDGARFTADEWKWLQARHNRLVDNLVQYVEEGGGLVGIHAATDSCYKHAEYGDTIGGYFWGHPWNAGHKVTIVVEDPEHEVIKPVFEGMKDFKIQDEIYQFKPEPYSREKLRVLLHLDPERSQAPKHKNSMKREDNDYPVCWVHTVGKGRVFYSSLGHNHHIYWNPLMLKHFLAGIQFATGDLKADTTPSAKVEIPNLQ